MPFVPNKVQPTSSPTSVPGGASSVPTVPQQDQTIPKQKGIGILSKAAQATSDLAAGFLRMPARVVSTTAGAVTGALAGAQAAGEALAGDKQAATETLTRAAKTATKPRTISIPSPIGVNAPPIEVKDITPYGVKRTGEVKNTAGFTADLLGFGLEAASYVFGGALATSTAEQLGVKGTAGVLKTLSNMNASEIAIRSVAAMKAGAKVGAIAGAGQGLQADEKQIQQAVIDAGIGAGLGALLAGASSVFAPVLAKIFVKPAMLKVAEHSVEEAATSSGILSSARQKATNTASAVNNEVKNVVSNVSRSLAAKKAEREALAETVNLFKGIAGDPVSAENAVRKLVAGGADTADIKTLTALNQDELSTTLSMLDVAKVRAENKLANKTMPRTIMGQLGNDRVAQILDIGQQAGKQLGALRKQLTKATLSDESISSLEETILGIFQKRGLDINAEGKVVRTAGTTIAKSKMSVYQDMWDAITGDLSPKTVDAARQRIFAELESILETANPNAKVATLQSDVTTVRRSMLDALDESLPGFREYTEKYAIARDTVTAWLKAIGASKKDFENVTDAEMRKAFDNFAANTLVRLESNASQKMFDVLAAISETEGKLGLSFNQDFEKLATMSVAIEDMFNISKLSTFKGRSTAALNEAASAAADVVRGNAGSIAGRILKPFVGDPSFNQTQYFEDLIRSLINAGEKA